MPTNFIIDKENFGNPAVIFVDAASDDFWTNGDDQATLPSDNNRDFIVLTQSDTRAISAITSKTWFPQVMVEKHQMGSTGPRYFVPPNHDPIAENVDAELFIWGGIFGQNMINDMTSEGLKGISQHYIFDNY